MTRFSIVFFAALFALPMFGSEVFAQRPFERLQRDLDSIRPRGRILRELFGNDDDDDDEKERAERERDRQRRPTRAGRNAGPQPTPAGQSRRNQTPPSSDYYGRNPGNNAETREASHPSRLEILVRESKQPEGLIVEKINRTGAAWAAGIRQGDLIINVGGLKTTTRETIGEITGVLKDGDQIEFEYVRKGKKNKTLVQLGEAPEDRSQNAEVAPGTAPSSNANLGQSSSRRGATPNRNPRATGNRNMSSVLDRSAMQSNRPDRQQLSGDRSNWQVQPPTSAGSRTLPPPSQPATGSSTDVRQLQQQLEAQQRQIQQLQNQIQQLKDQQAGNDSNPDSLLDFDK